MNDLLLWDLKLFFYINNRLTNVFSTMCCHGRGNLISGRPCIFS